MSKALEYSISKDTAQSIAGALQTLDPGDTLVIRLKTETIKLHVIRIITKKISSLTHNNNE